MTPDRIEIGSLDVLLPAYVYLTCMHGCFSNAGAKPYLTRPLPWIRLQMELSKYLREHSKTIAGKQQLLLAAFAKALEVIPRQLCENAGFDSIDILNKLRHKHYEVCDADVSAFDA
jgi:hypothetical protein